MHLPPAFDRRSITAPTLRAASAPRGPGAGGGVPPRRLVWLWGPMVAYMAAIFVVSGMSNPPAPRGMTDKALHTLAYSGLGLVALRATSGGSVAGLTARATTAAWAIATAYGATDEYHQRFVPGRSPDLLDVRADAIGAGAGTVAGWAFGIIVRSRRRSSGAST